MNYYLTRYAALKAHPDSIVRKLLNYHVLANAGQYVVFYSMDTYKTWQRCGHVR